MESEAEPKLLKGRCTRCGSVFLLRDNDKCPDCNFDVVVLTYDKRQVFVQDERRAQPL